MKIDDIVKRKAGESEREKQYAKAFSRVTLQGVKKMEERRFLKCHLPISLLPPQLPNSKAKARYPSLFYLGAIILPDSSL